MPAAWLPSCPPALAPPLPADRGGAGGGVPPDGCHEQPVHAQERRDSDCRHAGTHGWRGWGVAPGGRQREPGASCGKGHALPFHPYAAAGRPSTFCAATTTTTTTLYRTSSPPACTAGLPHLRLPAHLQGQVPDPPRDLPAGGVLHRCAAGGGPAPARTGQARGAVDRQAALLPAAATQVSGGGVGGGGGSEGGRVKAWVPAARCPRCVVLRCPSRLPAHPYLPPAIFATTTPTSLHPTTTNAAPPSPSLPTWRPARRCTAAASTCAPWTDGWPSTTRTWSGARGGVRRGGWGCGGQGAGRHCSGTAAGSGAAAKAGWLAGWRGCAECLVRLPACPRPRCPAAGGWAR